MLMIKKLLKIISNFLRSVCKKRKIVAVIRLKGVITPELGSRLKSSGLSFEIIKKNIDQAFDFPGLKAVALIINSPGGSAVQAQLIHDYIRSISKEKNIPTYSFVEDVAASGGYWLACASDEIYASENSIVGSIGVIAAGFGFTAAIKKLGVERRVIAQGKNKSIYDPFLPVKEEDKKIIKSIQKDIYESFKKHVSMRRGRRLAKNKNKLFSGEFWSGKTGLTLGLVDGIGNFHEIMKEKYGQDIEYKFIEKQESWFGKKLLGVVGNSYSVDEIITQIREQLQIEKFLF